MGGSNEAMLALSQQMADLMNRIKATKCPTCDGLGSVLVPIPQAVSGRHMTVDCPDCGGSGEAADLLESTEPESQNPAPPADAGV